MGRYWDENTPTFFKTRHSGDTFYRLGKHTCFRQHLVFAKIGDNSGLKKHMDFIQTSNLHRVKAFDESRIFPYQDWEVCAHWEGRSQVEMSNVELKAKLIAKSLASSEEDDITLGPLIIVGTDSLLLLRIT